MTYLGRAQYWLIFMSCYEHFHLCRKWYTRRAGQLMRGPCVKKKAIFLTLHFSPGLAEGRWDDREGRPGGRGWESGSSVTSLKGSFQNTDLEQVISCIKFTLVSDSPASCCSTQSPSLVPAHLSSLIPSLMSLWTWWYQPCCCWPCPSPNRECTLPPPPPPPPPARSFLFLRPGAPSICPLTLWLPLLSGAPTPSVPGRSVTAHPTLPPTQHRYHSAPSDFWIHVCLPPL